jgi:hypothetical protein
MDESFTRLELEAATLEVLVEPFESGNRSACFLLCHHFTALCHALGVWVYQEKRRTRPQSQQACNRGSTMLVFW